MIVLDTDHVTLLERVTSPPGERLQNRLDAMPREEVATTIISFEEQMRGWLSVLAKGPALAQQIEAYRRLAGSWRTSAVFRFRISTQAPPSSFSGCARLAFASVRWT